MGIFRARVTRYHSPANNRTALGMWRRYIAHHKKASLLISSLILSTPLLAVAAANQHSDISGTDTNASVQIQNASTQPNTPPSDATNHISTQVQSSTSNGSSNTQVNVNGQNIPVPENGTVEETVPGNNNQSDVHITIDHQSSGTNNSSSSSLHISSQSTTQSEGGTAEE